MKGLELLFPGLLMRKATRSIFWIATLAYSSLAMASPLASANTTHDDDEYTYNYNAGMGCIQVYDPYEKTNRKTFAVNSVLDHFILRPVTVGYKRFTNDYTKARVSGFLNNVSTPLTVV